MKRPIRVAVTGAAGQIAYSLLFRIVHGDLLGDDQPVILQLLEVPHEKAQQSLTGVMMEVEDSASPLIVGMTASSDPDQAFRDADVVFLVGARPRGPNMERRDLLEANGVIFSAQGQALNRVASRDVKVLVVGNPANTNAYIAYHNAPDLKAANFTAMMRLDHNRARAQLALKQHVGIHQVAQVAVWGNHSASQYPDIEHARVAGLPVWSHLYAEGWVEQGFIPTVQQRGAAIINARGLSSAASAANAAVEHMRDWIQGSHGEWVSMGVPSRGDYGIPEGIVYGFPCLCADGEYAVVQGLPISEFARQRMASSLKELQEEAAAVARLI